MSVARGPSGRAAIRTTRRFAPIAARAAFDVHAFQVPAVLDQLLFMVPLKRLQVGLAIEAKRPAQSLWARDGELKVRWSRPEHPHGFVPADEQPRSGRPLAHASTGSGTGRSVASCAARMFVNAQTDSRLRVPGRSSTASTPTQPPTPSVGTATASAPAAPSTMHCSPDRKAAATAFASFSRTPGNLAMTASE